METERMKPMKHTAIVMRRGSIPKDQQAVPLLDHLPASSLPPKLIHHRDSANSNCSAGGLGCMGASLERYDSEDEVDHDDDHLAAFVVDIPCMSFRTLLQAFLCYDAIPVNSKILTLDVRLPVKKAFFALIFNRTRAALLWDSEKMETTGILSISDFINILLRCEKEKRAGSLPWTKKQPTTIEQQLEEHQLNDWTRLLEREGGLHELFIKMSAEESLFRAAELLVQNRIHRLPILDPGTSNPIHILTSKRLLRVMWTFSWNLPKPPDYWKTPKQLGIGVWGNKICKAYPDTPLLDCLRMMMDQDISGVPIVSRPSGSDAGGRLVNVYSRFDAIGIAINGHFDQLHIPVQQAVDELKANAPVFSGVVRCSVEAPMNVVLELLVKAEVQRMLVVDNEDRLLGVVGVSDILNHFVLRHMQQDLIGVADIVSQDSGVHLSQLPALLEKIDEANSERMMDV